MMVIRYFKVLTLLLTAALAGACCRDGVVNKGEWTLSYDEVTRSFDISKGSELVFDDLYAEYLLSGVEISSRDYDGCSFSTERIRDEFGKGVRFSVEYSGAELPKMVQSFYIYESYDYVLTDFHVESSSAELSSNYMAPVNVDRMSDILGASGQNRALFIPFDNDCWIRYQSHPLDFEELTSYEVTAVFNNDSRKGIVVGSVEHDNWKSAVRMTSSEGALGTLKCFGGVADEFTRDSKAHGALKGRSIKSPKVMLAYCADWRDGLDAFGQANALVAPPKAWDKAVPFGWNSWGALQFRMRYHHAVDVSDFYAQNLQNNNFVNADNLVYIGLDSGWNVFTEEELKSFVERCRANGQVAGIYWTPFTDWAKRPERVVKDCPEYTYADLYLYADGKPQQLDGAYAVDPTHPAVEEMMKNTSDLFKRTGFEYVKMDFMTHGAMEADSWYNPDIQTGIQAYNYGMKLLNEYFSDMYINLSISPAFPAQYAQSRRIACDAWNKMKDTEYTLNALSYGWWLDKPYQFNDPDHIVLRDATEGENRARVTSGVITGIFICGDDFSGEKEAADKAMKFLTNVDINRIANGISFRPVDGNGVRSENQFVRIDGDGTVHYAIFNYGDEAMETEVDFAHIGMTAGRDYDWKELWSGSCGTSKDKMKIELAAKDVAVYRFDI